MVIARGLAVVLALAVCAWFALGYEQAHDTARAQANLMHPRLTAAQESSAASELSTAGTLNPDETVNILRAQLYLKEGRVAQATRVAEEVANREPWNLQAWVEVAGTTGDGPEFRLAFAKIAELDHQLH